MTRLIEDGHELRINDAGIMGEEGCTENLSRGNDDPISRISMKGGRKSSHTRSNSWRETNALNQGWGSRRFQPFS